MRVLYVEDQADIARIMSAGLRARGHEPVVAGDGLRGLEAFESEGPFDVVLLDIMLPGIDGFEVFARLKALPGFDTPVVFLSGTQQVNAERALREGAAGFLTKPVSPLELGELLQGLIE